MFRQVEVYIILKRLFKRAGPRRDHARWCLPVVILSSRAVMANYVDIYIFGTGREITNPTSVYFYGYFKQISP